MIKHATVKAVAAVMAVWAAWSLGNLASMLSAESARAQALDEAIAQIRTELTSEPGDVSQLARSMGYIQRGDLVFFDGG